MKKTFSEREPIKLYINSLGGGLDSAITIIDAIQMSRTPVYTFNTGTVQKESFLIYLSGHKRLTYSNATFMYSDSILMKMTENENTDYSKTKVLDNIFKNMKLLFLDRVNMTETQYDKNIKKDL